MSEKKLAPLFGVGTVTLLTVLLVLCLTMFSVLSLSSAQADYRLSEKSAAAVTSYYAADAQAAVLMAAVEALWLEGAAAPQAGSVENALLQQGCQGTVLNEGAGLLIYCTIPVQGYQNLELELELGPPAAAQRWQIHKWQLLPQLLEIEEEPLPVWQGDAS